MSTMQDVIVYCDGAWKGSTDSGGWGAVIIVDGDRENAREIYGGKKGSTNNQMEITAALRALEHLTQPSRVKVITDSQYLVKGASTWIEGWKKKGWVTGKKQPVKNDDLWKALDAVKARHDISWEWVKGHSGVEGNERADTLATMGAREAAGSTDGQAESAIAVRKLPADNKPETLSKDPRLSEPTATVGLEFAFGFDELIAGMNKRLKRHGRTEEVIVGSIVGYQVVQKNGLSSGGVYRSMDEIPKGAFDPEIDILRPVYAQAT